MASSKLLSLEALRGGAALFVVLHNFLLGFMPESVGILPFVDNSNALVGNPLFAFINGMAAVMAFFVLSGFVLSLRGLRSDGPRAIADAAVKRWFRLAPVVTLSVLLSWLLFQLGLFHFQDAAKLSRSDWLHHFAYGMLPQNHDPGFFEALWQGAVATFVKGDKSLNSNLWTMMWEFYGSFLVFALALLLRPGLRRVLWACVVIGGAILFHFIPLLVPFLVGVAATALEIHKWKFKWPATLGFLLGGLYLCGYWHPVQTYIWAKILPFEDQQRQVFILSIGAFLLLVAFASQNPISRHMNGRCSKWLGQISFPVYLVHMLVIASFSSWVFVNFRGGATGLTLAALTTIFGTAIFTFLFTLFDKWWVTLLSSRKI